MGTSLQPGRDFSSKLSCQPSEMWCQLGSRSSVSRPVCSRHQWGPLAPPWPPAQPARARRRSFAEGFSLATGAPSPHLCSRPGTLGTLSRNNPRPVTATVDGCLPQLPPPSGRTALRCLHSASQRPRQDETPVACSGPSARSCRPPFPGSLPSAPISAPWARLPSRLPAPRSLP